MADQVAGRHGRGMLGVEDAARGGDDLDRPKAAFVVGDFGRDRALHREAGVGVGVVHHHVDAVATLGRAAGVVDRQLVPVHGDRGFEQHRRLEPV